MIKGLRSCAKMDKWKRIMNIVGYLFIKNVMPTTTVFRVIHMKDER